MAEWKKRADQKNDVVFFSYAPKQVIAACHEAYVWDVDKTYLDTKFETLRGLLKTATEKPNQKRNIPGSAELVRSMKDNYLDRTGANQFPLFFITGSPPQMENKIKEKLVLDGVKPLAIFCKDNLPNLRPKRFWRLNKQVGYKLQALLQLRASLPADVKLTLFGDDGEADSIIYSLFSDICARRHDSSELRRILNHLFVLDDQVDTILDLQNDIPTMDPVEKIYINLVDDTDADYYLKFGRRVLPTSNSFQMALDLLQDQKLTVTQVETLGQVLLSSFDFTKEELAHSLDDLVRRQRICDSTVAACLEPLKNAAIFPPDFAPSLPAPCVEEYRGHLAIKMQGVYEPWVPENIDYTREDR